MRCALSAYRSAPAREGPPERGLGPRVHVGGPNFQDDRVHLTHSLKPIQCLRCPCRCRCRQARPGLHQRIPQKGEGPEGQAVRLGQAGAGASFDIGFKGRKGLLNPPERFMAPAACSTAWRSPLGRAILLARVQGAWVPSGENTFQSWMT